MEEYLRTMFEPPATQPVKDCIPDVKPTTACKRSLSAPMERLVGELSNGGKSRKNKDTNVGFHPAVQSPTVPKRMLGRSKWYRLSERKFITIRKYAGTAKINIRDYNSSESGRAYSTKRGILLSKEEWEQLKLNISSIDAMLQIFKK